MRTDGQNHLVKIGVNSDIIETEIAYYHQFKDQPTDLVRNLRYGLSIEDQCRSIFAYLVDHVRYKLDPDDSQFIKSPARLLYDGTGDCKSLTMFICSCLHCLGITHKFRFVNFDGSRQFSHVYAVAVDEQGQEIILDACELDNNGVPMFDYARPYSVKKDFVFYER